MSRQHSVSESTTVGSMSGAEAVVSELRQFGVTRVFVYPGGTIAPLVNACVAQGVAIEVMKSEQGAGFAAIGYAQASGQISVVFVTSGPGVTNVITPLADAYYDSTPVLFVTGQVGRGDLGTRPNVRQRGFQEVPTVEICRPISKVAVQPLSEETVVPGVRAALLSLTSGRPGPAVLDFPMDLQQARLPHAATTPVVVSPSNQSESIDANQISEVARVFAAARRPVILLGHGAKTDCDAQDLQVLSERFGACVVASLRGVGTLATTHPRYFGYIGHTGNYAANRVVHESDLLLVLGSRLDLRQTGTEVAQFAPHARVIWVDIDKQELAEPRVAVWKSITCRASVFVRELLSASEGLNCEGTDDKWIAEMRDLRDARLDDVPSSASSAGVEPRNLIDCLGQSLPQNQDVVVTTGVGLHQQWAARHLDFGPGAALLLTSAGHGTMGFDLPAAAGAAIAKPEATVVCLVGDGSLLMNIQELAAVAERSLNVKVVVFNNGRLGIVSQFQNLRWGNDPTTGGFKSPDFSAVANAFGIQSVRVEEDAAVRGALRECFSQRGPFLLDVAIPTSADVVPMMLAGQAMNEMWMGEKLPAKERE